MKRLTSVLTAALMLAVIATGCSKDESENMEENKQTYQYNYFEEPILDFSLTLEQLKAKETHKYYADNLWEPWPNEPQDFSDPWLARYLYSYEDGEYMVTYCFEDKKNGGVYSICLDWDRVPFSREKASKQLAERYGEPSTDANGINKVYESELFKVRVVLRGKSIVFYSL